MLSLRRYEEKDGETILSWIQDEDTYYKWSAGILGTYPITLNHFKKFNDMEAFMVIEEKEIGFFTIRSPEKNVYRIGFVILDPKVRGKGLGAGLIKCAIQYIKTHYPVERITLGVFLNNERALRCYQKVGFKEISREEVNINNLIWQGIDMELSE